jgi:hypothetical protein
VSRPIIPDLGFVIDAIPKLKAVPEQKVHLEGKAEEIWDRFYLVWRTTEQSLSPLERAATKRVPSYVLKLGMTYAAMEGTLPQITAGQLTAALMVGNYAAKCARHLIGARFSGADPQRELEGKITAILNQTPGRVVSKRNLHRALARHFRNAEQFNRVVWSMSCSGLLYLRTRERGRVDVSAEPLD